jgi:hypothetical protein
MFAYELRNRGGLEGCVYIKGDNDACRSLECGGKRSATPLCIHQEDP